MRYSIFIINLFLTCITHAQGFHRHVLMDEGWKFYLGDTANAERPNFNDKKWRVLDLPHDWSIEGEFKEDAATGGSGGYLPTGIGWYRKQFNLPKSVKGQTTWIEF